MPFNCIQVEMLDVDRVPRLLLFLYVTLLAIADQIADRKSLLLDTGLIIDMVFCHDVKDLICRVCLHGLCLALGALIVRRLWIVSHIFNAHFVLQQMQCLLRMS